MAKGLAVFIALVVFVVSIATTSASAYGMGKNNEQRDTPEYKAAMSFVMIGSVAAFISLMVISYHGTKLYCR